MGRPRKINPTAPVCESAQSTPTTTGTQECLTPTPTGKRKRNSPTPVDKTRVPLKPTYRNDLMQTGFDASADGDFNHRLMLFNRECMALKVPSLQNVDEVNSTIGMYFEICDKYELKPPFNGLAMVLGLNRQSLWAICNNAPQGSSGYQRVLPKEVSDSLKKAYSVLQNNMETYMASGKINPVAGIFLAKNHFAYKDQTETVVTANTQQEETFQSNDLADRYLSDSNTVESDFAD